MPRSTGRSNEPLDPLLTSAEAASVLNITEAALAQWRWRGIGPVYVRFGRSIRYRRADLVAYIEASIVPPQ